jgi:hypothetical protein
MTFFRNRFPTGEFFGVCDVFLLLTMIYVKVSSDNTNGPAHSGATIPVKIALLGSTRGYRVPAIRVLVEMAILKTIRQPTPPGISG